ncbi:tetratricopeptide repeat protein [Prosthecomicrobium pneumaticum]|uniref:DUF560 domain-containing protein n=1 Tax=Prosthecomicrobium pneumaticum TaxID=81895 RepID=A0A7W9FJN1_9HYPH|nr:tetratricopeptide repeat protein [Prosthecomicrobium pneumaticum]MBB5751766.1 hypothetical protein [Prosthecomicrobium pneumaticum]
MKAVYQRILADPTDTAANLDYARLAEAAGQDRKALATYERILLYEPENTEARAGLTRLRRLIQPNTTIVTAETGVAFESNPTLVEDGEREDVRGFVNLRLQDERRLGPSRWRTVVSAGGDLYLDTDELNYAYGSVTAGPVVDLGASRIAAHPFVGGTLTGLEEDYYYSEAFIGLQLEGYLEGANQLARIRAGYRSYGETWSSTDGVWADVSARLSKADLIGTGDLLALTPSARWSDIDGSTVGECPLSCLEAAPGRYWQAGVRLDYYRDLTDWLTVGAGIGVRQTWYDDPLPPSTEARDDFLISPTVSVTLHDLLAAQTDFKIDYRYDHNDSTDANRDYENHTVSAKAVTRF